MLANTHSVRLVSRQAAIVAAAAYCLTALAATAQTPSPVHLNSALPYRVELRPYSMGAIDMPTLHSFAVGEHDGKFVFLSGRTNGLHGFDLFEEGFPAQYQNRDVWVVDFQNKQSWRRSLDDASAGLNEAQILSLASTNNQFYQRGDTLYLSGGYGTFEDGSFGTHDRLTAIDLPGLTDWVVNGSGSAMQNIRQIHDPLVQVTGGAMHEIGGRTHLSLGQKFTGSYSPFGNGQYTQQIRSFDIVDDGVNLSIANVTTSTPNLELNRRDLNVVPVLRPNGMGGADEGLLALSGVFTPLEGAWLQPVEIDAAGNPTWEDSGLPTTFRQGMNNYHSAKLGMYSQTNGSMHEILFGGISLQYLNEATQQIETDEGLPFVNDVTSIVVDASGEYSQHHLGFFPELFDLGGKRLRFGANAEFLLSGGVPTFANGVIDLDQLAGETSVGFIYGGIETNAPHTRFVPGAQSGASNHVFEVVIITVPEPSTGLLAAGAAASCFAWVRSRRRTTAWRQA